MGKFGTPYQPPSALKNRVQPILCPEAYPSYTTGVAASWPSVSGTKPTPRETFLFFELAWARAGVPIRSTLLPYGNLAVVGTQTQALRQAVYKCDGLFDDGTAGGLQTTLLSPFLVHSAPMVLSTARTLGGGRIYKFPFDGEYTPVEDQPVILATGIELLYLSDGDTAPSPVLYGGGQDSGSGNAQRWPHVGSGGSYLSRNYYFNTLITAALSALDFTTYASPGRTFTSYAIAGGATAVISTKTITFNLCLGLGFSFAPY